MSTYRLDTAKLIREVDRCRHRGAPDEISYREVARMIGVGPSLFSRLGAGLQPSADALCSLIMWLNPDARLSNYVLEGGRESERPPSRRTTHDTAGVAR
jgi:hypothetical protein